MDERRPPSGAIVVFDGVCVLCSANAQLILRNDSRRHFHLAAMQGQRGTELLRSNALDPSDPDTLIVIVGDRVLRNSDAVLYIYRNLGWPWRAAGILRFVPAFVRDPVYRWVARNRYRLFGKRDACWLPTPADRDHLL